MGSIGVTGGHGWGMPRGLRGSGRQAESLGGGGSRGRQHLWGKSGDLAESAGWDQGQAGSIDFWWGLGGFAGLWGIMGSAEELGGNGGLSPPPPL